MSLTVHFPRSRPVSGPLGKTEGPMYSLRQTCWQHFHFCLCSKFCLADFFLLTKFSYIFGLVIVYHIILIPLTLPEYDTFTKLVVFLCCLTSCYVTFLFIYERWFLLSLLSCSRIEKGQTITFNPEAFVRTRKNMQPFLRKILQSQIFQQVRNI